MCDLFSSTSNTGQRSHRLQEVHLRAQAARSTSSEIFILQIGGRAILLRTGGTPLLSGRTPASRTDRPGLTMPQNRRDAHYPSFENFSQTSRCHAQPIPLVRRGIFFYDLPDHVLPSVVGEMHHAPPPDEWPKKFEAHFPPAHVPTLRDAAFCHNSSGFLAAPYAR